ncbi:hypothetical protein, partial [Vibrio sp.]|uniref:hypothetical protein n=1 Tax=Vibrio sp. TaxID=678 RepID=UPI003D0CB8DC
CYIGEYDSGNIDYAKIATGNIEVHTYNADGSFNKDLSGSLNSGGQLTFTANDLENGGYVTIFDNVGSASSPNVHTLSIQKELLSNMLINVEALQGNQASCYTSGKVTLTSQQKSLSLASSNTSLVMNNYGYESYRDGQVSSTANLKNAINIINTSEEILTTGLYDSKVVAAKLVKAGDLANSGTTPTLVELETLSNNMDLNWTLSAGQTLTSGKILTFTSKTGFEWQELLQTDLDFNFIPAQGYSSYLEGSYNGWEVYSNQPMNLNLAQNDVVLTEAIVSTGLNPQINSCSSGCVIDTNGAVSSNDKVFQRSYFEVSGQAKHTVYAIPGTNSETVIPDYNVDASFKPVDNIMPEVSMILTSNITTDLVQYFMTQYNAPLSTGSFVDKVSVVATPQDEIANKRKQASLAYQVIQK